MGTRNKGSSPFWDPGWWDDDEYPVPDRKKKDPPPWWRDFREFRRVSYLCVYWTGRVVGSAILFLVDMWLTTVVLFILVVLVVMIIRSSRSTLVKMWHKRFFILLGVVVLELKSWFPYWYERLFSVPLFLILQWTMKF